MKKPTIFMVDDCSINHLFFKMFVNSLTYDVSLRAFLDPVSALKVLKNEKEPILVVLDVNMPEMTGWEFMEELEKHKVKHKVVIASSSKSKNDEKNVERFPSVVDYVKKPFDKRKVYTILTNQLKIFMQENNIAA